MNFLTACVIKLTLLHLINRLLYPVTAKEENIKKVWFQYENAIMTKRRDK